MSLFNNDRSNNEDTSQKYSSNWFSSVSDEELSAEREPIRQAHCRGESGAWELLNQFNAEETKRMNEKYEKEHPNVQARHREHGWYLQNDE